MLLVVEHVAGGVDRLLAGHGQAEDLGELALQLGQGCHG
jgi:hypothetical protein